MGDHGFQPCANSGISAAKGLTITSIENRELPVRQFGVDAGKIIGAYTAAWAESWTLNEDGSVFLDALPVRPRGKDAFGYIL